MSATRNGLLFISPLLFPLTANAVIIEGITDAPIFRYDTDLMPTDSCAGAAGGCYQSTTPWKGEPITWLQLFNPDGSPLLATDFQLLDVQLKLSNELTFDTGSSVYQYDQYELYFAAERIQSSQVGEDLVVRYESLDMRFQFDFSADVLNSDDPVDALFQWQRDDPLLSCSPFACSPWVYVNHSWVDIWHEGGGGGGTQGESYEDSRSIALNSVSVGIVDDPVEVPEPGTLPLLGAGLVMLMWQRRRLHRRRN